MVHIGKLELMSYLAGDISDTHKQQIIAHIGECSHCKASLELLQKEHDQFLISHPAAPPIPAKQSFFFVPKSNWHKLYAIAAVLLLSITGISYVININQPIRTKGCDGIRVFCKSNNGISELSYGSGCNPGDFLQFSYSNSRNSYLFLASIDTSGAVSVFFPENSDSSAAIVKGADIALPNSIMLDSYIGPELYIAVFSLHPCTISSFTDHIQKEFSKTHSIENLSINPGKNFSIKTFLIYKENGFR